MIMWSIDPGRIFYAPQAMFQVSKEAKIINEMRSTNKKTTKT